MVKAKCIQKIRDNTNTIIAYRLQDKQGRIVEVSSKSLKETMLNNRISIINLQLTSDYRLIDKVEKREETKNVQPEVKYEQVDNSMNNMRLFKEYRMKLKLLGDTPDFNFKVIDNKIYITKYNHKKGKTSVTIPAFVTDFIERERIFEGISEIEIVAFKNKPTTLINTFKGFAGTKLKLVIDTSNVINMDGMFQGSKNLKYLDLGDNFDTSRVVSMAAMFAGCDLLEALNLGYKFNTSNVEDMSFMFCCKSLKRLDLGSKFYTSKVKDMRCMFKCPLLESLTLGDNFDTSSVENMEGMFSSCNSLKYLDVGDKFYGQSVTDTRCMFKDCSSIEYIFIGNHFNTIQNGFMQEMFFGCESLKVLDLGSEFSTASMQYCKDMFNGCYSLNTIIVYDETTWNRLKSEIRDNVILKKVS